MSSASSVGLVSGIDYETIIAKTRAVNSRPISLIQMQASKLNTQNAALQSVSKLLAQFKTASEGLSNSSDFFSFTSSSSNTAIASASADANAAEGSYSVKVKQLATAHRIASQGVDAPSSSITGGGTFSYRLGTGSVQSITLNAGDTLQDLVDKVNANTGAKVKASLINDGSPTNPYRLVLTSSETGQANQVSIVQNDTTLNLATPSIEAAHAATSNAFNGTVTSSGTYTGTTSKQIKVQVTTAGALGAAQFKVSLDGGVTWGADNAFTANGTAQDISGGEGIQIAFGAGTQNFAVGDTFTIDAFNPTLQKAGNAMIEVDGIQVQRSSNTFDDVIGGVSIVAKKVDTESTTISVRRNGSGVSEKINAFMTAYNQIVDGVKQLTAYNTATNTGAALFGDSAVTNMVQQLRNHLVSSVPFLSDYQTLNAIGMSFDGDGKLKLDNTKLTDALAANPDAVRRLFSQGGTSSSSLVKYQKSGLETASGTYSVNVTTAAEKAIVTGTQVLSGTLAANERLTLVDGSNKTVAVQLTAGQTMTQIVDAINAALSDKGAKIVASNDGGKLKLSSTEYGATGYVRVRSDMDGSTVGQLGIGTANIEDRGVDVAGTINGVAATGEGQYLTGPEDSSIEGLQLLVEATAPTTALITLTQGIAFSLNKTIEELTDSKSGMFATRSDRITSQLKTYDTQIEKLNERLDKEEATMRARFTALETKLSQLQSQGSFLQAQLASLI
jgi:flagellar hook-associated protein 2